MERDNFITKAGVDYGAGLTLATGGKWTGASLTVGGLCLFNQDQTIIDGTTTVLAGDITGNSFSMGLMSALGIRYSVDIDRNSFSYTKVAYVAPVAAVKYLGDDTTGSAGSYSLNLPSTISLGDTYGVSIRDRSKSHEDGNAIINYMLTVVTGDLTSSTTSANIIAKLVALINGNSNSVVTALAMTDGTDNDGIRFTADTAGIDFDIILMDGTLSNSQVVEYKVVDKSLDASSTNATANNPGVGTPAQALAAERDAAIQTGDTRTQWLTTHMYDVDSLVVAGTTYTVYSLYFTPAMTDVLTREIGVKQLINIFVPSGESGTLEVIAVLDEIFALINP